MTRVVSSFLNCDGVYLDFSHIIPYHFNKHADHFILFHVTFFTCFTSPISFPSHPWLPPRRRTSRRHLWPSFRVVPGEPRRTVTGDVDTMAPWRKSVVFGGGLEPKKHNWGGPHGLTMVDGRYNYKTVMRILEVYKPTNITN